jgi:hypothetical protein
MNDNPPIHLLGRPVRIQGWSLGIAVALAVVLGAVACGNPVPTSPTSSSVASPATQSPNGIEDDQENDLDGLVVLSGGVLSLGRPGGEIVTDAGPGGRLDAISAASGRLLAQAAGPAISVADIDRTGTAAIAWRPADAAIKDAPGGISAPALSPRGDRVVFLVAESALQFRLVTVGLDDRTTGIIPVRRGANGPPVWIDGSSLLLEVVADAGGSRFLRMNLVTGAVAPIAADGFGPTISGDGSVLAVASSDGSVVAVAAAGWLNGDLPAEGSLVDAGGSVFDLGVDATGRRIAIAHADDAGDPSSIAVFVRDGDGWRRHAVPVRITPDDPTMLGWLD